MPALSVGLFSIGLDVYWPQFQGLEERLKQYNGSIAKRLERDGVRVNNLGLIDTPERALQAGHEFRRADVDVIFLHAATYALSSTVLPVVRRAKVPVIILNLAPGAAIDYDALNRMRNRQKMTGEWLAWCGTCPIPEISNVFSRAKIPFVEIDGTLFDDPLAWAEIDEWVEAARCVHVMAHNRMGLMGHYYGGMLDIYTDLTQQCATFGGHIELIEVEELVGIRWQVSGRDVEDRVALFRETFDIQADCSEADLECSARTSVALDLLVERHQLGSLAYYYRGTGDSESEETVSSLILGNSLLTARHIPVAGEYEVKNVQAMKMMDSLDAGGSFSEYYGVDYEDDVILFGHDGPGHIAIADNKVKVRPLSVYHGKVGRGLSVEMSVRRGPVTLLSVAETEGSRLKLLMAEAEAVPGPVLEIGNTNSRYRFPTGVRGFLREWNRNGPAHHCAIGLGHVASKLQKVGWLLGLETVKVC